MIDMTTYHQKYFGSPEKAAMTLRDLHSDIESIQGMMGDTTLLLGALVGQLDMPTSALSTTNETRRIFEWLASEVDDV